MTTKADHLIYRLARIAADIHYDDTISPDDPRYVDLSVGRGAFSYRQLFAALGLRHDALHETEFAEITKNYYGMFLGHRGSGKSTELKKLCNQLSQAPCHVVFVDILSELNEQDFKYTDVVLAIVRRLAETLQQQHALTLPTGIIKPLQDWAKDVEIAVTQESQIGAALEAGVNAEAGLPFLANIFAKFTASIKNNTSYKKEIREQVRNRFADLASAFMMVISHVENHLNKRVIFIIDGTDRLSPDAAKDFFQNDISPLRSYMKSLFLFCANIILVHQQRPHGFHEVKLPMIKSEEKNGNPVSAGRESLRRMILARVDSALFAADAIEKLISFSGGHPRDLLRLVSYSSTYADGDTISSEDIDKAANQMASEFRRLLEDRYLPIIIDIDQAPAKEEPLPEPEILAHLVDNNLVLEYNDYWLKSHPCVRLLPNYQKAWNAAIPLPKKGRRQPKK